ncbi:MAG: magnesium chelatase family protein, partial [Alphaproteobacteria bacterium]
GSAEVLARVIAARARQAARFTALGMPEIRTNSAAPAAVLDEIARLDAEGTKLLRDAAERLKLTARAFHRVLKVARTLADLDAADLVARRHLAEALALRSRSLTLG